MKPFTSFTKQQLFARCPRRFFYRYFCPSIHAKELRSLMSVRELGGHCVHSTLAQMVRRIADGERVSDQFSRIGDAMTAFDEVVAASRRLRPGVLAGEMQLAEMYNGVPCETEIRDWRELVGIAVTNGVRMMDYFNLRTINSRYQLAAEERMEYVRRGVMRRFVIDVMIGDEAGVTVIDWKTHSITKTDIRQVEGYQEYLLDVGLARPTRVYGFAVDLLHEEVQECHYRKIKHTFTGSSALVGMRSINPKNDPSRGEMEPYPARPSFDNCSICPFATLCPSSVLSVRGGCQ